MTNTRAITGSCLTVLLLLGAAGCSTPSYTTSSYHPGPVGGRAVGTGVGVAAGNVAGFVVGTGEGLVGGATAPFDTTTHVVRRWRTETTADGRTIQVYEDILVDSQGRPVNAVAPAPAPAPVAPPAPPAPVVPAQPPTPPPPPAPQP